MNFIKFISNPWCFFYFILAIIIVKIILDIILFFNKQFEKTITVSNKYHLQRASRYHVVDQNDENYRVTNVWFKGDFNRGDRYGMLNEGESYKIKGYGIRIPVLNMDKNIYSVEKV